MLKVNPLAARGLVGAVALAIAMPALGQKTFVLPFLMNFDDGTGFVGWNAKGGQPSVTFTVDATGPPIRRSHTPIGTLWSVEESTHIVRRFAETFNNPDAAAMNIRMLTARREATTRARMVGMKFPECDANQKESRGVEIDLLPGEIQRLAHEAAHVVQQTAKRQKMWLCSNFRLTVEDWPTQRVSKIEAITAPARSVDGTLGIPFRLSDIAFTIPNSDRKRADEELVKALDGNPSLLQVRLEYLDGDGMPLLALRMECVIKAVGLVDPFADPNDPDAALSVVLDSKNKKITLESKEGDIDIFCK